MFSIFRHASLVGIDTDSQAIRQLIISAGELSFVSISGVDERLRCGRFDRVEQPLQRPDPRHLHRRGELDGAPAPLLLQEHLCWV